MDEEAENALENGIGKAASTDGPDGASPFTETIGRKATRKLRAKRQKRPVWGSLGLMGTVGWSVAIPTLIGAFLGQWLDARYPESERSWTLVCLMAGLFVGCVNAWLWVGRENALNRDYKDEMRRELERREQDCGGNGGGEDGT